MSKLISSWCAWITKSLMCVLYIINLLNFAPWIDINFYIYFFLWFFNSNSWTSIHDMKFITILKFIKIMIRWFCIIPLTANYIDLRIMLLVFNMSFIGEPGLFSVSFIWRRVVSSWGWWSSRIHWFCQFLVVSILVVYCIFYICCIVGFCSWMLI